MAGKTAILSIRILGDASEASKAMGDAEASVGRFQGGIEKAAKPAALALAGIGAAAVDAAKAASEDQQAAALLAQTLRNTTGATDAQIAATEAYISKTSKAAAVADDELRPALATLVRSTGDVAVAQDAMSVALDVSAATGKDVESVSAALAKGYAGNTTALGRLVPGLDKAVLATGDMEQITAELARTTGGSAAAAANTAAGQWENAQIQFGEAKEAIGAALLPAMTALGAKLVEVAGWVQDNTTTVMVLVGVLGGLAAAILIVNAAFKVYAATTKAIQIATKAWTAVQWLLNAAMAANPIVLIIIAVVALVAAFVLLWQRSEAFRNFWIGLWDAIVAAAQAAWDGIVAGAQAVWAFLVGVWNGIKAAAQTVWNGILAVVEFVINAVIAYGRFVLSIYVAIWNGIIAAARWAWDGLVGIVRAVIDKVVDIVRNIGSTLAGIWNGIIDTARGIWDRLYEVVRSVMDKILTPIRAVRDAFDNVVDAIRDVINWLGRIKIPDVLGSIGSAIGGIFRASPAAASRSFAGASVAGGAPTMRAGTLATATGASRSASGGLTINVNGALDPVSVARQIRTILRDDERRRGGVRLTAATA